MVYPEKYHIINKNLARKGGRNSLMGVLGVSAYNEEYYVFLGAGISQ